MDDRLEGSLLEMDHARLQKQEIINEPLQRRVTIDILPDDVLLVIFDYYVAEAHKARKSDEWQMLVHVCQNWRYVVFQSPLRLNLRILCSAEKPVREKLALWPPFPIIIMQYGHPTPKSGPGNIIAALRHGDRVCAIHLTMPSWLLESVFQAMQKTFVALEDLSLQTTEDKAAIVSDSFLGGSAPHLRHLVFSGIRFPFPVLRNLLLAAHNLVTLSLNDIPRSVYISPEAIVTCLSALTRLNQLCIGFKSPQSSPSLKGRHRTPTRSVLPALTELTFHGDSDYLGDLVAWIDAPLLSQLRIKFFHQLVLDTLQLVQFISRTPKLKACDEARVIFSGSRVIMALSGRDELELTLGISCSQTDWRLSSMAQVIASSFPHALIPMLEHLYILDSVSLKLLWQDDLENNLWLELFRPFATVKNLYLSQEFVECIIPTLQELVGERVPEVLPNLQSIVLEDLEKSGFIPEYVRQFIAARQFSSHPITISLSTRQDKWLQDNMKYFWDY